MCEDLYKNCRWCHWYKDGSCQRIKLKTSNNLIEILEDGVLSESIREGFFYINFESVSKSKRKEFENELGNAINNWVESIDESVSTMIKNRLQQTVEFAPEDALDFYCKYYM